MLKCLQLPPKIDSWSIARVLLHTAIYFAVQFAGFWIVHITVKLPPACFSVMGLPNPTLKFQLLWQSNEMVQWGKSVTLLHDDHITRMFAVETSMALQPIGFIVAYTSMRRIKPRGLLTYESVTAYSSGRCLRVLNILGVTMLTFLCRCQRSSC